MTKILLLLTVFSVLFVTSNAQNKKKANSDSNNYGANTNNTEKPASSAYENNLIPETDAEFLQRTQWFTDAKFGMFIHFGLYSQLEGVYKGKASNKYAEWIQADLNIKKKEYAELIKTWNPKDFSAKRIVKAAKSANMKYLVITTKHHEGFCLWPSDHTEFDIENSPMKGRDFIQELSDECKKQGIVFGTYYSLIDWNHPSQNVNWDKDSRWARWGNIEMDPNQKEAYVQYMKDQIKELIVKYDSKILWFDGDWTYWWTMEDGIDLYNYIRSIGPDVIINNRVAKRAKFKKDFGTPEQEHHENAKKYLWEACYTMNNSWGFKKSDNNWKSPEKVYDHLQDINTKGGNFLLNIGPDKDGRVPEASVEILKNVGKLIEK